MDPVTHGLAGALIAEAGFLQRLGRRCRPSLIVAAMFPDIDILYRIHGLPKYIENHRGLSHSFVGIIAAGILFGAVLGRFDEERRYLPWMAACWAALFSHQLLDLITSYGTQLLYPFENTRYFFDWVFIIDIFLTAIFLIFIILCRTKPQFAERRAKIGLIAASAYVAFCALNHTVALYHLRQSAKENQMSYSVVAAIPLPFSPTLWSGILDAGSQYYRVPMNSWSTPAASQFEAFTKANGSIYEQRARNTEMGTLYFWFARYPVMQEHTENGNHIVEFYDLRFYRVRLKGYLVRTPFVLRIRMDEAGNVLETKFARS